MSNQYKARLHIAVGKFNFIEVDVEDTIDGICQKADYLNDKYLNKGI